MRCAECGASYKRALLALEEEQRAAEGETAVDRFGIRYGVAAGVAMLAVAASLFWLLGWEGDRLLAFPLVFLVAGLAAIVRGLRYGNYAGNNPPVASPRSRRRRGGGG